jgi:hypothetical protein
VYGFRRIGRGRSRGRGWLGLYGAFLSNPRGQPLDLLGEPAEPVAQLRIVGDEQRPLVDAGDAADDEVIECFVAE